MLGLLQFFHLLVMTLLAHSRSSVSTSPVKVSERNGWLMVFICRRLFYLCKFPLHLSESGAEIPSIPTIMIMTVGFFA
jgi:hypothetical protein